jgi:hypothetical protein
MVWPERRGAGKGAPVLGAAKRTLAGEHRSGTRNKTSMGGAGGNTFPLVSLERFLDGQQDRSPPGSWRDD